MTVRVDDECSRPVGVRHWRVPRSDTTKFIITVSPANLPPGCTVPVSTMALLALPRLGVNELILTMLVWPVSCQVNLNDPVTLLLVRHEILPLPLRSLRAAAVMPNGLVMMHVPSVPLPSKLTGGGVSVAVMPGDQSIRT